MVESEDYEHSVGHCQRCATAVEPLVSTQWFVKMESLAERAVKASKDGEFRFRDFVSLSFPSVTPSMGDVLAHYVIGFDVGPGGFGTYRVGMGSAASNFFARSILPPTLNTLTPDTNEDTFMLVAPEPTSGLLVLLGGTVLLRRRRRRCRI